MTQENFFILCGDKRDPGKVGKVLHQPPKKTWDIRGWGLYSKIPNNLIGTIFLGIFDLIQSVSNNRLAKTLYSEILTQKMKVSVSKIFKTKSFCYIINQNYFLIAYFIKQVVKYWIMNYDLETRKRMQLFEKYVVNRLVDPLFCISVKFQINDGQMHTYF